MRKRRTLFLLFAGLPALVFIFSVVFYFSAARLINSEFVREKFQNYLLGKTGSSVSYRDSEIHLFPLPEIIFNQVNISMSGKAQGSVETLRAYPGFWSLMKGNVSVAKLILEAPHFTVKISEDQEELSLEEKEEKIRSVVHYLVSKTPGLSLVIQDGKLDLTEEDRIAFFFDLIQSQISVSKKTLDIKLTGRSNLWDDFSISSSIRADDLKSEGTIRFTHLHPDVLIARLFKETDGQIGISDADLSVKFEATGLRVLKASVENSVSGLKISRGKRSIALGDGNIRGEISIGPEAVSVRINEVKISRPALDLSGHYTLERKSGLITLDVEGKEIAVLPVRASALAIADDIPTIRTIFDYLWDGEIPAIHVHADGKSLSELGRMDNIRISGKLRDGVISVGAKDLTFQDVAGDVEISQGILDAGNVGGSLDNHQCSGGKLRIGLKGKDAPFHIDMRVKADVAQLPSLLRQKHLIQDEPFLREMERIQDLRGSFGGRLVLGDRLDAIHVKIIVDDMQITARYEPVPFPLALTGGRLFFDENSITVTDLDGSIGQSSFSRLTGRLGLDRAYDLEITGGRLSVSADEIYPWITSSERTKQALDTVRSLSGFVGVSSLSFRGQLYEADTWQFLATGETKGLTLDAAFLPGKAEEMGGTFTVTQNELSLKNIQAKLIDSLLTVSGVIRKFPSDIRNIDLSLRGEVGQKVNEWITALIHLPPEITIRAPFSITGATLSLEKDRQTAFSGWLLFGEGTKVSLSVMKNADTTAIREITIKDMSSDVAAGIILTRETIDAAFKGKVTAQTLSTIFKENIFSNASLDGDFTTHIVIDQPRQSIAEGRLKGENIPIPWGRDIPLMVKHISLETEDQDLLITSAELAVKDMNIEARGKVSRMPKWFSVDMDLSSNGIVWETLESILRKGEPAADRKKTGFLKDLPVRGSLRLRSDFFQYQRFRWEPFHADLSFDGETALITTKKTALCGVSAIGTVGITEQGVKLDIALSAKDLAFEPTVLCITNKNADYTGIFELEAHLRGEGTIEEVLNRIEGPFTLSAKDGKILKARTLDKTFDLLNESENFKGEFPDLDREIISYKVFKMRGSIREHKLQIEEGVLDASVIGIMARGHVDFGNETLYLNALVAPLNVVNRIVRKIPVMGYILGGTLTSIPVRISGNIKDPQVSFLPPSAIGSEALGIVERIIKLPVRLVEPIFPAKSEK